MPSIPSVVSDKSKGLQCPNNYVGVFITSGYLVVLSGEMRQGGEDTIRWREKRRWRPCVEFLMADLPTRDFDLYTRPFRRWMNTRPALKTEQIDRQSIPYYNFSPHSPPLLLPSLLHLTPLFLRRAGFFMQISCSLFLSKTGRLDLTSIDRRVCSSCFFNLCARVWLSKKNPFTFVALFSLHFVWTGDSCTFEYNTGRIEIPKSPVNFLFFLSTAFLTYSNDDFYVSVRFLVEKEN